MIRTAQQLESALYRGETVFKRAISTLVERGTLQVIARDICNEPMQWGRA